MQQSTPTYGTCEDCGGRFVLDPATIAGPGFVHFECNGEGCDWSRVMSKATFEAQAEQQDIDVDALVESAEGGVPA